jgi:protein-disulfide isomerase
MAEKNRRKNVVRNTKAAQSRRTFYAILGAIMVIGVVALSYVAMKPTPGTEVTAPIAPPPPGGAKPEGYMIGNPNAPVHIMEFADFECPSCARFTILSEPDVRKRIINAGLANFTFYDFPLPQHRNSQAAHNAAACAGAQNKFWEMHDLLFNSQDQWDMEATNDPKSKMVDYAKQLGLDMPAWEKCFDSRKFQYRIDANAAEGARRNVNSTPTFVIGNKMFAGSLGYDEFKQKVDEAVAANGARPAQNQ